MSQWPLAARYHSWDLSSRQPPLKLPGGPASIDSVAFSSDGNLLVASGEDDSLACWALATGECEPMAAPGPGAATAWPTHGSRSLPRAMKRRSNCGVFPTENFNKRCRLLGRCAPRSVLP